MDYDNVKLWFAHRDGNIVTIDEINEKNKNYNYSCPVCGSELKPKAIKSKQVSSHFAHIDSSKCNSETLIHWWFKHRFLEVGDTFSVVSDKERQYTVKEIIVERSYQVLDVEYRPDVTIHTECGNTIYFEMAFSNKKKVKDYLDIWLELKNTVVEIDIKQLILKNRIPAFKALFFEGKCFNTKKNNTYYNTIGKYKEEKLKGKVDDELKERLRKLEWFWDEIVSYKKCGADIERINILIDSVPKEDMELILKILSKTNCTDVLKDCMELRLKDVLENIENQIKESHKSAFRKNISSSAIKYVSKHVRGFIKIDYRTYDINKFTISELVEKVNEYLAGRK